MAAAHVPTFVKPLPVVKQKKILVNVNSLANYYRNNEPEKLLSSICYSSRPGAVYEPHPLFSDSLPLICCLLTMSSFIRSQYLFLGRSLCHISSTSTSNYFLTVWCSFILLTCPNHFNLIFSFNDSFIPISFLTTSFLHFIVVH